MTTPADVAARAVTTLALIVAGTVLAALGALDGSVVFAGLLGLVAPSPLNTQLVGRRKAASA